MIKKQRMSYSQLTSLQKELFSLLERELVDYSLARLVQIGALFPDEAAAACAPLSISEQYEVLYCLSKKLLEDVS